MNDDLIALVASDQRATEEIAAQLRLDGYRTVHVQNLRDALIVLAELRPLALVLEDMPDLPSTLAFVRLLRLGDDLPMGVDPEIPIVVRSDGATAMTIVAAVEAGADAFHDLREHAGVRRALLVRLLQRARGARERQRLRVGPLTVDVAARAAHYAGRQIECSGVDFALLARLAIEPTRVVSKTELLAHLWGWRCRARTRAVDRHAARVRDALAEVGAEGFVVEVRGEGFRLVPFAVVS